MKAYSKPGGLHVEKMQEIQSYEWSARHSSHRLIWWFHKQCMQMRLTALLIALHNIPSRLIYSVVKNLKRGTYFMRKRIKLRANIQLKCKKKSFEIFRRFNRKYSSIQRHPPSKNCNRPQQLFRLTSSLISDRRSHLPTSGQLAQLCPTTTINSRGNFAEFIAHESFTVASDHSIGWTRFRGHFMKLHRKWGNIKFQLLFQKSTRKLERNQ